VFGGTAQDKADRIMESDLIFKPTETTSGLDTVRARAKKQHSVRLSKAAAASDQCQIPRTSLQKIRTLKSLAAEVEDELAEEPPVSHESMLSRAWDWFQRSIGNR
jgi:hypothetical protein